MKRFWLNLDTSMDDGSMRLLPDGSPSVGKACHTYHPVGARHINAHAQCTPNRRS